MKDDLKKIVIEDFESSTGKKLQNLQLSYQFFGKRLGTAPIILINHALTGNSIVSGKNGWWSEIVGPNLTIDTDHYSILAFNIPGNGVKNYTLENYSDFEYQKKYFVFVIVKELQE